MTEQELKEENQKLKNQIHELNDQLKAFIPRRRIRAVYKMLGKILEKDTDTKEYVEVLKTFINKIEKEGKAEANQEIKTAIEHLLSVRER